MEEVKILKLLKRMENGDELAFAELYAETRHDVFRMVKFLIREPHDAVEVANEVYVQLWKSFRTFDNSRPFRFWLHGIAVHQANNHRRKLLKRFRLFEKQKQFLISTVQSAIDPLIRQESRDELLQQIMRLSKKLRTSLVLRYYHDYSFEEIASLLNTPVGTVKSRHHAALQKLRISYEKVEDSNED